MEIEPVQLDRVHLGQMHLEAARLDEKSLKTQNATEFAQLDKKLLLARVTDREEQQSHLARAPTRCRVTHGVRCRSQGGELVVDRARKVERSGRVRKVQSWCGRRW